MAYNYFDKTGLSHLWDKIKGKFVAKEFKTGSDSVYKVLSDNNLTDELVEKINQAGVSDFTGNYSDLFGKPSIEGHELASGNNTAASLGLATPSDVSNATNDMATQTWVEGQNYATSSELSSATNDMATQTWVSSQNYATTSALNSATADMATQTWVESKSYATTSNVNTLISQAVSTVYTPKGSTDGTTSLAGLMASGKIGDVYNVTSAFVTDGNFVEGSGQSYPAGTNVVLVEVDGARKWDVLAGSLDTSSFILRSEMIAITTTEIDEICV